MKTKDKQRIGYLLGRCALNDQAAFEQLYQLTSPNLYGLLFSMLNNEEDCCDVLQLVFEKIWRNNSTLANEMDYPWAWMCQITRNAAIDRLRSKTRLNIDDSEQGEAKLKNKEDLHNFFHYEPNLDKCMSLLSDSQRVAISHIYHYGYSQSEVSQLLGKPLGTVKSWVRRALEALKLCLS